MHTAYHCYCFGAALALSSSLVHDLLWNLATVRYGTPEPNPSPLWLAPSPMYALAIWCDPEMALAKNFAGYLDKLGCQDSHEDPDSGNSQWHN